MADTTIEWTDKAWNVLRGCTRVSPGCVHCYAERQAARFAGPGQPYEGLVRISAKANGRREPRWTGAILFVPEKLAEPLSWRKPRRVFVNSMSDLFHEGVTDEQIAAIFGVMAASPQHTFQVLTKRPERARVWFRWVDEQVRVHLGIADARWLRDARRPDHPLPIHYVMEWLGRKTTGLAFQENVSAAWPLPNVWLGVSVEDQATADERIPLLLDTPAAIRWVSYEPALGPVDFHYAVLPRERDIDFRDESTAWGRVPFGTKLDWIVVGGESGPGARPFDIGWARSAVEACRDSDVPCFVKQLGPHPYERVAAWGADAAGYDPSDLLASMRAPRPPQMEGWTRVRTATETAWYRYHKPSDRKGGDIGEWPEDIRVREWPVPR